MSDNTIGFVSYTKEQRSIVENGIDSIAEVLNGTDDVAKRSLLFCLDKYLDPYYGYNLSFFDDIIILIQQHLFLNESRAVKEDILDLLSAYSKDTLDYLADRIELIDPDLLSDALYALGNTFNQKYIPIFIRYENHHDQTVCSVAKEALLEFIDKNMNP